MLPAVFTRYCTCHIWRYVCGVRVTDQVAAPSADPRVIVATYRVTPGEQQQIRKAAAQSNCTVTDLIRRGLQAQGALPAPK
jgi:hypothetical protein